jgi:diguanylate cyclase (GGDEF)-like protein
MEFSILTTHQTLMQQMGLSQAEIVRRLHVFNITSHDFEMLSALRVEVESRITNIVDRFYANQLENPEIVAIIGDAETFTRLRGAMSHYIATLFAGSIDDVYVNNRLRIGKVHKRIGVTPKLYLDSVETLRSLIDEAVTNFPSFNGDPSKVRPVLEIIHRVLLFDAQLIVDSYIDSYMGQVDAVKAEIGRLASDMSIDVPTLTRQMHEASLRDELTGLFNYRSASEFLKREVELAKRYELPLCIAYFDLNKFKAVNDSLGHAAGDEVLRATADAVRQGTRTIDIACRYDGDEFCVIFPRTSVDEGRQIMARINSIFARGETHGVSFSVGLAQTGPESFISVAELLKLADARMYTAKAKSRIEPGFQIVSED